MYKIFVLSLSVVISITGIAQKSEVNWMTFAEVEQAMVKEPKKIIIDVYTDWCGPCKMMMKNTYGDKEIIDYINKHFYAIKFDAESAEPVTFQGQTFENPSYDPNKRGRNGTHQMTYAIANKDGRVAYPTTTFFTEDIKIWTLVQGYLQPDNLMPILVYFAEDYYKEMTHEEFMSKVYSN
jgi:thioredoxin-related protein